MPPATTAKQNGKPVNRLPVWDETPQMKAKLDAYREKDAAYRKAAREAEQAVLHESERRAEATAAAAAGGNAALHDILKNFLMERDGVQNARELERRAFIARQAAIRDQAAEQEKWSREVLAELRPKLVEMFLAEVRTFAALRDAFLARREMETELANAGVITSQIVWGTPAFHLDYTGAFETFLNLATHYYPEALEEVRALKG